MFALGWSQRAECAGNVKELVEYKITLSVRAKDRNKFNIHDSRAMKWREGNKLNLQPVKKEVTKVDGRKMAK